MLDRFETPVVIFDSLRLSFRENCHDDGRMISSAVMAEHGIGSNHRGQIKEADGLRFRNQRGKSGCGYRIRDTPTFVPWISGFEANFAAIGQAESIRRASTEAR
jgi:hypothetical protein